MVDPAVANVVVSLAIVGTIFVSLAVVVGTMFFIIFCGVVRGINAVSGFAWVFMAVEIRKPGKYGFGDQIMNLKR